MKKKTLRNSPEAREYLIKLGNPYAAEQIFGEGRNVVRDEFTAGAATQSDTGKVRKLSKTELRAVCRAIFGYYIPAIENGRLRAHHGDLLPETSRVQARRNFAFIRS